MSARVVREGPHRCDLGYAGVNRRIVQCDDCGRYWVARTFPNPQFNRWSRLTWLGLKLRGIS